MNYYTLFMENWRNQDKDSSTTSEKFPSSISDLPQIYHNSSDIHNHFSTRTLHIPSHNFQPTLIQSFQPSSQFLSQSSTRMMTLEESIASIAAGQNLLVESLARLMTRLDETSPRHQVVNDLAAGIGKSTFIKTLHYINDFQDRHIPIMSTDP